MKEQIENRDIYEGANGTDEYINQKLHRQRSRWRTVMEDTIECSHTILPIDLFSFFYGSRSEADCAFVDPTTHLSDLCCHFRLESKPVFFKINSLNDLPTKQLITSLHVGYVEICEHV